MDWESEVFEVAIGSDIDRFQEIHEGATSVPAHIGAGIDEVFAVESGDRNEVQVGQIEAGRKVSVVAADLFECLLAVSHQVHFVDGHYDVANAEEGNDEAVPFGLSENPVSRVDQDNSEIGGRGPGRHVSRVLFMAGGIGDDELSFCGRKVSVRHIDRDTLLAFGAQAVGHERGIEAAAGRSVDFAFCLELGNLVFVEHLAVVEQASDQGAFSVVDASAGDEAEQFFAFVLLEVSQDILGDQITLVRHIV